MSEIKYFVVPFDNVPDIPNVRVWYAAWSEARPIVEPGAPLPMVVGATAGAIPSGAEQIGVIVKDPPPPPPLKSGRVQAYPPTPPPLGSGGRQEYEAAFAEWAAATKGE